MLKGFQKTAKNALELQLPHPGIITFADFYKHFELHCYAPSPDLQPFVAHIWIQRARQPLPSFYTPIEILSGPNVYLFFTPQSAFIHGITKKELDYNPHAGNVIVGVKFKPGGFYPFLRYSVSTLNTSFPITSVFAKADHAFVNHLLAQPDTIIVHMIETLLRNSQPKQDKNLALVSNILHALATNNALQTVRATAKTFGMSERSLQLLFHTYVGVGVKWIIARKRLLEAISRAQSHPHPTWAEIAAELGYSSQSHLSRDFKATTGIAPSDYIKSLR